MSGSVRGTPYGYCILSPPDKRPDWMDGSPAGALDPQWFTRSSGRFFFFFGAAGDQGAHCELVSGLFVHCLKASRRAPWCTAARSHKPCSWLSRPRWARTAEGLLWVVCQKSCLGPVSLDSWILHIILSPLSGRWLQGTYYVLYVAVSKKPDCLDASTPVLCGEVDVPRSLVDLD